jgi:4-amino-4-deoxy-L-arabinose transferase-like glycosyltransferase
VALLLAALVARLGFAFGTPRQIHWPDGRENEAVALSLLEHGSYGTQTLRPPGYPTLIAGIYSITGRDLLALRIVEAVLGTLVVGAIAAIGAAFFGPAAGWLAGALAALHPVLAFLPSTQYSENTLLLALVPAFGMGVWAARRGGMWRWALTGALFGLGALVRPNSVLLVPGFAAGLALALRGARRSLVLPALVAAGALALTVAPWIVRCHEVHGRWFFVATGGGRQFWFGNNPAATGSTRTVTMPDSALMAELMRLPDEAARERLLYARGLEFVREHPGRAAQLYLVKLANLFALWPETLSQTFVSHGSRVSQGLASVVIFLGALLAAIRHGRDPAVGPLLGAIASYALANAVFFTVMRYRIAFEPCLLWLAGLGWATVLQARWPRAERPAPALAPTRGGKRS